MFSTADLKSDCCSFNNIAIGTHVFSNTFEAYALSLITKANKNSKNLNNQLFLMQLHYLNFVKTFAHKREQFIS